MAGPLARLGALGDRDTDPQALRTKRRLLVYMAVLMSGGGITWGTLCVIFGLWAQAIIPFSYTLLTAVNLTYFGFSKNFHRVQFVQILLSLVRISVNKPPDLLLTTAGSHDVANLHKVYPIP